MNKKYWECTITIDGGGGHGKISFDRELLKETDEKFGVIDMAEMYRKITCIVENLESKGYNVVATNIEEKEDFGFLDGDTTYIIRVAILK